MRIYHGCQGLYELINIYLFIKDKRQSGIRPDNKVNIVSVPDRVVVINLNSFHFKSVIPLHVLPDVALDNSRCKSSFLCLMKSCRAVNNGSSNHDGDYY